MNEDCYDCNILKTETISLKQYIQSLERIIETKDSIIAAFQIWVNEIMDVKSLTIPELHRFDKLMESYVK